MPADLTASALIALLREHPVCCGRLGIGVYTVGSAWIARSENGRMILWEDSKDEFLSKFRLWLTGACVEHANEHGIDLPVRCLSNGVPYYAINDGNETRHPTFLHAMLAAIERHPE